MACRRRRGVGPGAEAAPLAEVRSTRTSPGTRRPTSKPSTRRMVKLACRVQVGRTNAKVNKGKSQPRLLRHTRADNMSTMERIWGSFGNGGHC
eukprot:4485694-Pyramimonas_sp.AAC.1